MESDERVIPDPLIQASIAAQLPTSARPRNAKNHKSDCKCKLCLALQYAIDNNIPTKAEREAEQRLRGVEQRKAREAKRIAKEEQRRATAAAGKIQGTISQARVESAVAAQLAVGRVPSIEIAAKIAGVSKGTARNMISNESVEASLARNGITTELLDSVALSGLSAGEVRLIIKDGEVVDSIEIPDHHARHKFWRDCNIMVGRLGADRETNAPGGLVIVAANSVQQSVGHEASCTCDDCTKLWEEKTRSLLSQRRVMKRVEALPESIDSLDSLTSE